jgi:hypothetical protein
MATNNIKKLPLEPRLPVVGGTDYDQQLSRALYDILRQLATRVNALDSTDTGTGFAQLTAASTTTIPAGVQFVNLTGNGNINTLTSGTDGQVVVITCTDSPIMYALGIFTALEPNSIVIAECVGGNWFLRGLARNVAAVLASGTGSWSAGAEFSQTIAHGLGYAPDIKKVQVQMTGLFPTSPVAASLLMSVAAVSATYITVNRPDSTHAYSFAWRIYS